MLQRESVYWLNFSQFVHHRPIVELVPECTNEQQQQKKLFDRSVERSVCTCHHKLSVHSHLPLPRKQQQQQPRSNDTLLLTVVINNSHMDWPWSSLSDFVDRRLQVLGVWRHRLPPFWSLKLWTEWRRFRFDRSFEIDCAAVVATVVPLLSITGTDIWCSINTWELLFGSLNVMGSIFEVVCVVFSSWDWIANACLHDRSFILLHFRSHNSTKQTRVVESLSPYFELCLRTFELRTSNFVSVIFDHEPLQP